MALLKWKLKRSLTKSDLVQFCLELSELFSTKFQAEYKFRPLSRVEGGIECYIWPGRRSDEYKQIRFSDFTWECPWPDPVPDNWQEEWTSKSEKGSVIVEQTIYNIWYRRTETHNIVFDTYTKWKKVEQLLLKKYMQNLNVI